MTNTLSTLSDPNRVAAALMYAARRAGEAAVQSWDWYPEEQRRAPRPKIYKRFRLWNGRPTGETYMSKWKSQGQAYKVHQLALAGKIPYRRTGGLGQSITSEPFARSGVVGFRIGSNKVYAALVIGNEKQQADYHKDFWTPLEKRVRENKASIAAEFKKAFLKELGL